MYYFKKCQMLYRWELLLNASLKSGDAVFYGKTKHTVCNVLLDASTYTRSEIRCTIVTFSLNTTFSFETPKLISSKSVMQLQMIKSIHDTSTLIIIF